MEYTDKFQKYRLRQSLGELARKRKKAARRKGNIWTQEDMDHAKKSAAETGRKMGLVWAKGLEY